MSFLRHLTGYAPTHAVSALASFGGVYAFTRLLGPEEYGRYALLISLLAIIHTISLTWAEAANYRFAAKAREEGRMADHYALALRLMGRSILAGLTLTALIWWAIRDIPGYGAALPWLGLLLPINTVVQMALEAHRAGLRVGRYVASQTMQVGLGFVIGVVIAAATGIGTASPLMGMALAGAVVAVREGLFLRQAARGGALQPGDTRAWIIYGAPIAAALMLDLLLSAADRFLIAFFLGEAAVGAYAAGYGVADKTVLLLCAWPALSISPLIMAAYERDGPAAAAEEARGLVRTLLMIGLPAASGLALVAVPLGEVMVGKALREQATQIIPWIAFAGLLNGLLIHYASEAFQLARRTALRAMLMLVPAGLNIALNLVLLPWIGVMGAVYATLISYAVGLLLLASVGRGLVALPWPVLDALKIGVACAAMAPVIWLIPNIGGWLQLMVEAPAGAMTYAGVLLGLDAGGVRGFLQEKLRASNRLPPA